MNAPPSKPVMGEPASTGEREELVERVARAIFEAMDVTDGLTLMVAKNYARAAIDAIDSLTRPGLKEALEEARSFVVVHGPAAAFPDLLAKIDQALASVGG